MCECEAQVNDVGLRTGALVSASINHNNVRDNADLMHTQIKHPPLLMYNSETYDRSFIYNMKKTQHHQNYKWRIMEWPKFLLETFIITTNEEFFQDTRSSVTSREDFHASTKLILSI